MTSLARPVGGIGAAFRWVRPPAYYLVKTGGQDDASSPLVALMRYTDFLDPSTANSKVVSRRNPTFYLHELTGYRATDIYVNTPEGRSLPVRHQDWIIGRVSTRFIPRSDIIPNKLPHPGLPILEYDVEQLVIYLHGIADGSLIAADFARMNISDCSALDISTEDLETIIVWSTHYSIEYHKRAKVGHKVLTNSDRFPVNRVPMPTSISCAFKAHDIEQIRVSPAVMNDASLTANIATIFKNLPAIIAAIREESNKASSRGKTVAAQVGDVLLANLNYSGDKAKNFEFIHAETEKQPEIILRIDLL
ncbi:hypothetical protein ACFL5U_01560 [Candidatus Margulisiibacteriota bacterium]